MIAQNRRLYPPIYAHNYYILSRLRELITDVIDKYIENNVEKMRILDYGCGSIPYISLFSRNVSQYVTCDIEQNSIADIKILPDGKVPIPDNSFDIVISIQVLEHVEDVKTYLAEAHRLIAGNGKLLLSTHGQWIWHPCPKDLWRWTKEGLICLIEKSGFEIIEIKWISGMLAYSSQLRLFNLKRLLHNRGHIRNLLFYTFSLITNFMMFFMDKFDKEYNSSNAAVYFIVARKVDKSEI